MIDARKIVDKAVRFLAPLQGANWKVIFLCFFTASTFWFFNALNKVYTTRIDYPIDLVYNHDTLVAVKDPPARIPINVTGGGWQLLKNTISLKTRKVTIEPENPVQTQFLTAANLLPIFSGQLQDININYIAVDTIFFRIEPYRDRRLKIEVDSAGISLRENFYITSAISVEPDSVIFHGPKSFVEKLSDVFIVSLPDRNISRPYDEELSLDLFSPSIIKKIPEVIRVRFDVEEFIDMQEPLEIQQVNFPYDSTVFLETNSVEATFKIPKSLRNNLNPEDILIIADLSNIRSADSTISIEVMDVPFYVKDLSLKENRVKVVYAKK